MELSNLSPSRCTSPWDCMYEWVIPTAVSAASSRHWCSALEQAWMTKPKFSILLQPHTCLGTFGKKKRWRQRHYHKNELNEFWINKVELQKRERVWETIKEFPAPHQHFYTHWCHVHMCSTLSSHIPSLLMPCWIMDQHPFLPDILQKSHPSAKHAATPQVTHDVGKASTLDGFVLHKEKRWESIALEAWIQYRKGLRP